MNFVTNHCESVLNLDHCEDIRFIFIFAISIVIVVLLCCCLLMMIIRLAKKKKIQEVMEPSSSQIVANVLKECPGQDIMFIITKNNLNIDPLDESFLCVFCRNIMQKPVINCLKGCIVCSECTLQKSNICPENHYFETIALDTLKAKDIGRKIESMNTHCVHYNVLESVINGCSWSGAVNELMHHLSTDCQFATVCCTNEGCDEVYLRSTQFVHTDKCDFKVITCEHCTQEFFQSVIEKHYSECERMNVDCPNQCGFSTERNKMNEHLISFCPNSFIDCVVNAKYGCCCESCNGYIRREDETEHLSSKMVSSTLLKIMINEMKSIKETSGTLSTDNKSLFGLMNAVLDEKKILINQNQEIIHENKILIKNISDLQLQNQTIVNKNIKLMEDASTNNKQFSQEIKKLVESNNKTEQHYTAFTLTTKENSFLNNWVRRCHEVSDYETLNDFYTEILYKKIDTHHGFKTFHMIYEFEMKKQNCMKTNFFIQEMTKSLYGFNINIKICHKQNADKIVIYPTMRLSTTTDNLKSSFMPIESRIKNSTGQIYLMNMENCNHNHHKLTSFNFPIRSDVSDSALLQQAGCPIIDWEEFINDGFLWTVDSLKSKMCVIATIQIKF